MESQKITDNILVLVLLGMTGAIILACSVIFFFLRYQRRFLRQREELQRKELKHREHLLHTVIQSQEEERLRISRDLHDHIGSNLSNLRMSVNAIQKLEPSIPQLQIATEDYKVSIDHIINDVRNISHSLFPPALALWGFKATLEDLCHHTCTSSGIDIVLNDRTDGILDQMSSDGSLALYRVIQELLNNTLKHAKAKKVSIETSIIGDRISIVYADDGIGASFTEEKRKGIGMYSIESRLQMIEANYTIDTSPGNGFSVSISIPVTQIKQPEA
jgi:signal transduction histidine kinase